MYNEKLVAVIKRILATGDDMEFLPELAEIAVEEIERLAREIERIGKTNGNPWLRP